MSLKAQIGTGTGTRDIDDGRTASARLLRETRAGTAMAANSALENPLEDMWKQPPESFGPSITSVANYAWSTRLLKLSIRSTPVKGGYGICLPVPELSLACLRGPEP